MATHVFAADLSEMSELTWKALVAKTNPQDTVVLVHSYHLHIASYFHPALGQKRQDAVDMKMQIYEKFFSKCEQANLTCKFRELPAHSQGSSQLAEEICSEALRSNATDIWIGAQEEWDGDLAAAKAMSAPSVCSSIAAAVAKCPCTVHLIRERNAWSSTSTLREANNKT